MSVVEGWKTCRLGDLVVVQGGFAFKSNDFDDGGIPIIRMSDLDDGHLDLTGSVRIKSNQLKALSKFALHTGDFLVGMSGSIGNYAIVRKQDLPAYLNQRVGRFLLSDESSADYDFLTQIARSNLYKLHVEMLAAGAAQVNISPSQIESFSFDLPPKPEQTRIAEILLTVDRAIEQTEALIAKQQRIKTGLMQDLLSRGIDEHGNLRSEQTHQFKDSPLGRIPEEWEVNTIGEIVQEAILGITFRGIRTDNVCPLIKMGNLSWGSLNLDTVEIVDQERDGSDAPQLEYRDFLFNTRNTPELVGKTVVWRSEINRATFDNNLLRLRFHESVASPFLNFYMSFGKGKDEVRALVTGTTSVAAIYWRNLKNYPFPRPPIAEQERTIKVIEDTLRVLDATRAKLHKLRSLKTALMQDLLTGKKHVTSLLNEKEVPTS